MTNTKSQSKLQKDNSSFRDPSGFIYKEKNTLYRQVNESYKKDYEYLISSGLYKTLSENGLLIKHTEVKRSNTNNAYKVLKPEIVPFISYPYEWSFSMLKDAALLTLTIQKVALQFGMTLKDASSYNVQFIGSKPIFIDTLSFEKFTGKPWTAYKQFCMHFLAPIALTSKIDLRLSALLTSFLDGLHLDLSAKMLPLKSKFNVGLLLHLQSHASSQVNIKSVGTFKDRSISTNSILAIIDSLESTIKSLKYPISKSYWSDYYKNTNYLENGIKEKGILLKKFLKQIKHSTLLADFGANTGNFTDIAKDFADQSLSLDFDPIAIESNYLRQSKDSSVLPLVINLANPSPSIGWGSIERKSFLDRAKFETVLMLALIHHLVITENISLNMIAELVSKMCNNLIIEFIPPTDSQIVEMTQLKKLNESTYSQKLFEESFEKYFKIVTKEMIKTNSRIMYLMKKK